MDERRVVVAHDPGTEGVPVKLPPFEYRRPGSVDGALADLDELGDEARLLAGGQSLVPLMAFRLARPTVLVDISALAELDGIALAGGALTIGAGTTHAAIEDSEAVRSAQPLLHAAVGWIGHRAIRTRGTLGGSLAHADPAAELPLVSLVLEAQLDVVSCRGTRTVPADTFFRGFLETTIQPDEIVTAVRLPALDAGAGCGFTEVARRHGDFATVSAAATVVLSDDGTIEAARLGLGAVASRPVRLTEIETALVGIHPLELGPVLAGLPDLIDPADDIHATGRYRRVLARTLATRALEAAALGASPPGAPIR